MRSIDFMRALPEQVRPHCPPEWRRFKTTTRPWLLQLYFHNRQLHYEIWNLGPRRSPHPNGSLELGLHFESRDRELNRRLLYGFERHLVEIKDTLGRQWEAEAWDKGWAKVYETIPREPFNVDYLETVAQRMGTAIALLQPIFEMVWRQMRIL